MLDWIVTKKQSEWAIDFTRDIQIYMVGLSSKIIKIYLIHFIFSHHFPHFRETPTKWKKAIWQCLTYGRYFTKTEIEASPNKYRKCKYKNKI